ncbi:hypothetical protein FLA_0297 [Filimonas lacunae]|nr:hypothetical protein FLA_0297 [Filimonas lacunae]
MEEGAHSDKVLLQLLKLSGVNIMFNPDKVKRYRSRTKVS